MHKWDLWSMGVGAGIVGFASLAIYRKLYQDSEVTLSKGEQEGSETNTASTYHCSCIIKIGGSACTKKELFETFNFTSVSETGQQIAETLSSDPDFRPILVHGAGSFGHFQAKQYSVAHGTDSASGRSDDGRGISPYLREGFSKTRLSVSKLNHHILTTLLAKGVPGVGISLFPTVLASKRNLARPGDWERSLSTSLGRSLRLGLVPVIHGDACLEVSGRETSIVSGDTFMVYLSEIFSPQYVVFLADVDGVLTAPPGSVPEPQLIRRIFVDTQGDWTCEHPDGLQMSQSENDVTGGIKLKLKSAVEIVSKNRIPVYIVKAGSEDARLAIRGIPPPLGTSIVYKP